MGIQLTMLVPGPDRGLQRDQAQGDVEQSQGSKTLVVQYLREEGRRYFLLTPTEVLKFSLFVHVPAKEPAMSRVIAQELLGIYVTEGREGVAWFGVGVFGLDAYGRLQNNNGPYVRGKFGPIETDESVAVMREHISEERRQLFAAYERERKSLIKRRNDCQKRIRDAAVEVAKARIERCRELLLSESKRYLGLAEPREAYARRVLAGGGADNVAQGRLNTRGPEWKALLSQLHELQQKKQQLESVHNERKIQTELDIQRAQARLAAALAELILSLPEDRSHYKRPDPTTIQGLVLEIADRSRDFQENCARAAAGYPILNRLLAEDVSSDRDIAIAMTEILQDAWQACDGFINDLEEPEVVWTLPRLIDRTVRERFGREAAFAERVAAETLQAEKAMLHPFEAVNYVVQGVDMALMSVPIPAVELATAVVSFLAGAAESVETYLREGAQRRSARAALDPSLALANEPSLTELLVQTSFVALSVLPIPGLAKELRESMKKAPSRP